MTISKTARLKNEMLALKLIGHNCADDFIVELYDKGLPHFKDILPTTWKRLADDRYISEFSVGRFQITPFGWIKALKATGQLCNQETRIDLGRLSAALKARIERTHEHATGALVDRHEIVHETGLAAYWVSNVIDSRLIAYCLRRRDAFWASDDQTKTFIEVPIDFGHPL